MATQNGQDALLQASLALTSAAARLDRVVLRVRDAWRESLGGLLERVLSEDELDQITLRLYEIAPLRYEREGLYSWESRWFDEQLPRPPAKLLVTAAGSGREVRALTADGYAVDALEPVSAMLERLRASGADRVVQASHADLVRAVSGDGQGPAAALAASSYDAIIIGWGSFTHLLSQERAVGLLAACDRLTPDGPLLASFFKRPDRPWTERRSRRLGRLIGGLMGRVRSVSHDELHTNLVWHLGFTRAYSPGEIDDLAAIIGRTAVHGLGGYGHATFRTPSTASSESQGS